MLPAIVLAASHLARAADWLGSPEATRFRDRVVLLALIYGESDGIDPHGYMVRTRKLREVEGDCAVVEVVTLQGGKEVRRETARACRTH